MKLTKKRYLQGFVAVVLVLALVRWIFPSVAGASPAPVEPTVNETVAEAKETPAPEVSPVAVAKSEKPTKKKHHRILSVASYAASFPSPVKNREDAEMRKRELVYVGANPYYHVDPLYSSIPYLVPRAAVLLQDIGQAFFDSLYVKGVPFHKLIVTSVLRTEEDVVKLRRRNGNATEKSCHLYGTTFDICYNRYKTVENPDGPARRMVRNDTLKWVLSEVLRDMREKNRCYIKYEVKQGCFHMTVR